MPTILVPIDLSIRSDRALRRASILAKASGSDLRLLHVLEPPVDGGASPVAIGQARQRLSQIAIAITEFDGVACESQVAAGEPVEQIALAAEDSGTSLVVTGPHKLRFKDFMFGPTAESLAKRISAPVLIANALPNGRYDRILIPTGLDSASAQIIRSIADLPLGGSHELFTVYIHEPLSTLMFDNQQDREDYRRVELKSADTALCDFLEESQLTDRVQRQVRLNRTTVGSEIEECASELGCDLIAIGSSQKPFFEKMVVGSVAEAVVREVDADIIIFP